MNMSLHGKKGLGTKDKKRRHVIRFWYNLENLHPTFDCSCSFTFGVSSSYSVVTMFIKCVRTPSFPHYFCPLVVLWIQRLDSCNPKPTLDIFFGQQSVRTLIYPTN